MHTTLPNVAGGESGTVVSEQLGAADATLITASPLTLFALASRRLAPEDAVRSGAIRIEGDAAALNEFPDLFDMAPDPLTPTTTTGE